MTARACASIAGTLNNRPWLPVGHDFHFNLGKRISP